VEAFCSGRRSGIDQHDKRLRRTTEDEPTLTCGPLQPLVLAVAAAQCPNSMGSAGTCTDVGVRNSKRVDLLLATGAWNTGRNAKCGLLNPTQNSSDVFSRCLSGARASNRKHLQALQEWKTDFKGDMAEVKAHLLSLPAHSSIGYLWGCTAWIYLFARTFFRATFPFPIMSTQPQRWAGRSCDQCKTERAVLRRPKNNAQLCKACFFELFEAEVHATITENALFSGTKGGDSCQRRKG